MTQDTKQQLIERIGRLLGTKSKDVGLKENRWFIEIEGVPVNLDVTPELEAIASAWLEDVEKAENNLLYELYYAADRGSFLEKSILERLKARGQTKHLVVPSALTNKSKEQS